MACNCKAVERYLAKFVVGARGKGGYRIESCNIIRVAHHAHNQDWVISGVD